MTLVRRLLADERVQRAKPSTEQLAMVEHIGETLAVDAAASRRAPVRRKSNGKSAGKRGANAREMTMERQAREVPAAARFLQDAAADADRGRASLRRELAARRGRGGAARLDRADPGRAAGAHRGGGEAARHRSRKLPIVDAPYSEASAAKAVELVREGKAEALMKGSLHTDELMGAVVRRETGLRTARRVSHCFVMDVPSYAETLIVTDAAVNIAPTLEDKVHIIQNAIDLAHAMRFPEVRVAILSAMETVNPKVPSTIEAGALCKMADRGQITGAILDGPLALDNAISLESVKIKKIDSPVAGRANVLVVPDLEAGNMLAKSLSFLAGADAAGIVLGARVPIILTSRADSVTTRLASCGIAALVAQRAARSGRQGRRVDDRTADGH